MPIIGTNCVVPKLGKFNSNYEGNGYMLTKKFLVVAMSATLLMGCLDGGSDDRSPVDNGAASVDNGAASVDNDAADSVLPTVKAGRSWLAKSDFAYNPDLLSELDEEDFIYRIRNISSFYLGMSPIDDDPNPELEKCLEETIYEEMVVESNFDTVDFYYSGDVSSCLKFADWGLNETRSVYDTHFKGQYRCPNYDLNLTADEIKSLLVGLEITRSAVPSTCAMSEVRVQVELALEVEYVDDVTRNTESIKVMGNIFHGAEVNGQLVACEENEVNRSFSNNCISLSITETILSIDSTVEQDYEELRYKDIKYDNDTDPYYSSGKMLFKINDWEGEVTYADGFKQPSFIAKRGIEEVSESLYDIENLEHD